MTTALLVLGALALGALLGAVGLVALVVVLAAAGGDRDR